MVLLVQRQRDKRLRTTRPTARALKRPSARGICRRAPSESPNLCSPPSSRPSSVYPAQRLTQAAQAHSLQTGDTMGLKVWKMDFDQLQGDRKTNCDPPGYDPSLAKEPVSVGAERSASLQAEQEGTRARAQKRGTAQRGLAYQGSTNERCPSCLRLCRSAAPAAVRRRRTLRCCQENKG